jgi:serine/threonine-protein kinase
LFDFGSMRVKAEPRPPRVDGTDPYIAPEEALMENVDEAADVFSLGVTLYEMLTGKLPFPDCKRDGKVSQVKCSPERLRHSRPRVSAALEDIVLSCLARAPAARPTIKKMLPALHDLIVEGPPMWPTGFEPRPVDTVAANIDRAAA